MAQIISDGLAIAMKNVELFKSYAKNPSIKLRNQIIEKNLGLVRKVAYQASQNNCEPLADLIQVGAIGLIKAVERFNINCKAEFSSFAVPYIRGEILHYLRDKAKIIKPPRQDLEDYNAVQLTLKKMEALGSPCTLNQALEACGISEARWAEILISTSRKPLKEIEENSAIYYEDEYMSLSAELTHNQYIALRLRYLKEWSISQISERLGISESEVNELIASAIQKLEEMHGN